MALITLRGVQLSLGGPLIFDNADFKLHAGEKVGLVGRNGEGKSTLFRLLTGELKPDGGVIEVQQGIRVASLIQEVPRDMRGSIADVVAAGLPGVAECLHDYHVALEAVNQDPSEQNLEQLGLAQSAMDQADAWSVENRIQRVLSRLKLNGEQDFGQLSGGMKRRVLLAQALVSEPDVLLLDEPTNHLDISAVEWLEEFLADYAGTLILITHDRAFLQAVTRRIVELDRGQLHSYDCRYSQFTERRAQRLEVEAEQNAQFDKKLAQEETWIRQGIKARRTRNEGRVRALQALRKERAARREQAGTARISMDAGQKSGKQVLSTQNLAFEFPDRVLFKGVDLEVQRGDKIGILGPNGAGKSTLLRILLGQEQPTQGSVELGTQLDIAYFDQLRGQLDPNQSALDNVSGGSDSVTINGQTKHIMGYMQDFLFSPERARAPISKLSGGERNRLLLAKLFTKPANLLVMDEPTNDLDAETLELLEALLVDYTGTLFLVSHDRTFINNVVTHCWSFEHDTINEYIGGYDDWVHQSAQRKEAAPVVEQATPPEVKAKPSKSPVKAPTKKKLSFNEQKELNELPQRISELEASIESLQGQLSDPSLYQSQGDKVGQLQADLSQAEQDLETAFDRWAELEEKIG